MLKPRRKDVLVFRAIKSLIEELGYSPSIREVKERAGVKSNASIQTVVARLVALQWIDVDNGTGRSLRVTNPPGDEEMARIERESLGR